MVDITDRTTIGLITLRYDSYTHWSHYWSGNRYYTFLVYIIHCDARSHRSTDGAVTFATNGWITILLHTTLLLDSRISSVYVVYHDDREAIFTFCIHSCFWFITACSIHSSLIPTHNNIVWSSLTTTVNCSPLMCFLLLIPPSNRMVYNAESFNENPNHKGKHIHLGCTDTERTRRRYHFR